MEGEWTALMRHVPIAPAAAADLRARLTAPDRLYHGLGHVLDLWRLHLRHGAALPVAAPPWHGWIACAIAFHDAIYDARRSDNEAASAALWRAAAPRLPDAGVDWVAGTILATADHLAAQRPAGMDAAAWDARLWMLDLDLSPLGACPAVFAANTERLRREYGHLDDAAWERGRLHFLRRVAAEPALFRTPVLAAAFAAQAQANLAGELARAGG